jgi:hypothetical protein
LFALSLTMVSGMVNSFIQMTFLIKVSVAVVVYLVENNLRSRSSFFKSIPGADKKART